jgi:hypothetical protein
MKKKLPIGIQAFSVLRNEDYLYIDKTELIHKMKSSGRIYFYQNLRMLLVNIPNILHKDSEGYYHLLFLLAMKMLGFDIQGEVMTNIGRIDAVLHQRDYEAYLDKKIMLMAVAFTGKEVKCEMKMYK